MTERCCSGSDRDAAGRTSGALKAIDLLALAASPTFAAMALMTNVLGEGPMAMLCSGGTPFPLGGMALMYLLMSAFHLGPWLKLISRAGAIS
jgi:hypothetical protein